MSKLKCLFSLACILLLPAKGWAEEAAGGGDSPIRTSSTAEAAGDAYGLQIGNQFIGLYNTTSIREFRLDSGSNYRLGGGYYSRLATLTEIAIGSITILAGPNLFNADFPSPTGVVSYEPVSAFSARSRLSLRASGSGSIRGVGRYVARLDDRPAAWWAGGQAGHIRDWHGGEDNIVDLALGGEAVMGEWTVSAGTSARYIRDQFGVTVYSQEEAADLPQFQPGRAAQPSWAYIEYAEAVGWTRAERSLTDRLDLTANFQLAGRRTNRNAFVFLADTGTDGVGDLRAVSFGPSRFSSGSGQVGLSTTFSLAGGDARLLGAVSGRRQVRELSARQTTVFGPKLINEPISAPDPGRPSGSGARDEISEMRFGASLRAPVSPRLLVTSSVQRVLYQKTYTPAGGQANSRSDWSWSGHGALAYSLSPSLTAYTAYVSGLEESGTAPQLAVNANETLPALRATQVEAGLRWNPGGDRHVIASAFEIEKAAPGYDSAGVWRLSGERVHRGVELSFTGSIRPGLRLIAGALFVDAEIREADGTRSKPISVAETLTTVFLQWTPSQLSNLRLDAGFDYTSAVPARRDGSMTLPARYGLSAGARWTPWEDGDAPEIRLVASNLLDERGWYAGSDEGLSAAGPRYVRLELNWTY